MCDRRSHHKNKINLHPLQLCNPLLKMMNMYFKMVAVIKGELMKIKKMMKKKKVHKCHTLEFAPPYKEIILCRGSYETSTRE
jgi:nicotinic acid phosphoribosyltransferase